MDLLMFVGNDLIDIAGLERDKISVPGYLSAMTRMLKEKHEQLLLTTPVEPEFLLRNRQQPGKSTAVKDATKPS